MERMDMPPYDYYPQRRELKTSGDLQPNERRLCQILLLIFGFMCLTQAALNVTLRLALHSGSKSTDPECNTTKFEPVTVIQTNAHCNKLQERFNALTRDKDQLQNQISELNYQKKAVTEQKDRLQQMLNDLSFQPCVCPDGWKEINKRCYFLSTEKRTWNSSQKYCQSQGANLVMINDQEEQMALYQMNRDVYLLFWIGLYDDENGSFKWVDNTPLTTSFWQTGQPDRSGPNNVESCVEMYHQNPVLSSWVVAPCGQTRQWLCEKEALRQTVQLRP